MSFVRSSFFNVSDWYSRKHLHNDIILHADAKLFFWYCDLISDGYTRWLDLFKRSGINSSLFNLNFPWNCRKTARAILILVPLLGLQNILMPVVIDSLAYKIFAALVTSYQVSMWLMGLAYGISVFLQWINKYEKKCYLGNEESLYLLLKMIKYGRAKSKLSYSRSGFTGCDHADRIWISL